MGAHHKKGEENMCMPKNLKTHDKMIHCNHNVHDKIKNLISLILQSTFILVLCFKQITTPKSLIHDSIYDWVVSCSGHP